MGALHFIGIPDVYYHFKIIALNAWGSLSRDERNYIPETEGPKAVMWARLHMLPDFGINWHFIHNWGGKLVLVLIALHVAAALKHHFYDNDDTLKRMLP